MEFTSGSNSAKPVVTLAPPFYDDKIVGILDGKYVTGAVPRSAVTAIRLEQRKSFKHPLFGFLVSLIFVGMAMVFLAIGFIIGAFFSFCTGAYVIWGVIRRRDKPWLVFVLGETERAFPLKCELSAEAVVLLGQLCGCSPTFKCRACGYDLRATPESCPECGATTAKT